MSADLRAVLDGKRTDGKRLSAHIAETAAAPWLDPLGKPYLFEFVDECNRSWRSLMEHEAIEVEALEAALAAAIEENDRLFDAIRDSRNSLLDIVNDMPIKSRWWKRVVRACGPLTDAVSARTEAALAQEKST